jgi:ELWxxDGT repeat protein
VAGVGVQSSAPPSQLALIDIVTGTGASNPQNFTNVGGYVYFTANRADTGRELWRSNGTSTGTVLVKDIRPGTLDSGVGNLTNFNGRLAFTATEGTNGIELWRSDGTAGGTVLVKNISLGSSYSNPSGLTNVNGILFFAATTGSTISTRQTELWKSDGTADGTVKVKDIAEDSITTRGSSFPTQLTNVNGILMFAAADFYIANNGTNGRELWRSDGTTGGTFLVKDINPGTGSSNPAGLTNVKGIAYFTANDGISGVELWKSTGNTGLSPITALVKDILPGPGSSNPNSFANLKGNLVFAANDGTNGNELWKSNGSTVGTTLLRDIRPGAASSVPKYLTNVAGTVFFSANNGTSGAELWRSNATTIGTDQIIDIRAGAVGSAPNNFVNVNGTLFFAATDGVRGRELWTRKGTGGGTTLVANINPGAPSSNPTFLTAAGVNLYFAATTAANGNELWTLKNPTAAAAPKAGSMVPLALQPQTASPLWERKFVAGQDSVWRSSRESLTRTNDQIGSRSQAETNSGTLRRLDELFEHRARHHDPASSPLTMRMFDDFEFDELEP